MLPRYLLSLQLFNNRRSSSVIDKSAKISLIGAYCTSKAIITILQQASRISSAIDKICENLTDWKLPVASGVDDAVETELMPLVPEPLLDDVLEYLATLECSRIQFKT